MAFLALHLPDGDLTVDPQPDGAEIQPMVVHILELFIPNVSYVKQDDPAPLHEP